MMITIENKKDAVETMKRLRLNYFPLDVFSVDNLEGIKSFFDKYPAKEYVMRNTDRPDGEFFFVSSFEEAAPLLSKFEKHVTIDVSYNEYKEDIVLVGDIKVTRGLVDIVDLSARSDSEATQRNIYENPEYNMHCTLEDEKLWRIPGISKIMSYIADHELYNIIVEFVVYDCKLGINKENVIINELRSSY